MVFPKPSGFKMGSLNLAGLSKLNRKWFIVIAGLLLIGGIYLLRGGWKSPMTASLPSLEAAPEVEIQAVLIRSMRALNDKNYDQAISMLKQALERHPRQLDLMLQLGMSYRRAKSFSEADRLYSEALRYYPNCLECLNNQAVNWLQAGDTKKATQILTEVNRLKPDYPEAYFNLAIAYERNGEIRSAVNTYQQYLQSVSMNDSHPEPALARERVRRLQEGL